MAGAKGRSGKVLTPEQRAARREAARAGGRAKARRSMAEATVADAVGFKEPTNYLELKDKKDCRLKDQKIEQGEIETEMLKAKRDTELGKLVTLDHVRARDERLAAATRAGLSNVQGILTANVPADRLLEAQKAAREWIEATLNQVAAAIEGKK